MDSKYIHDLLDKERRLYSNSKTEFSKRIGITKSRYNALMKTLFANKVNGGATFNTISPILEKLGYEIKILKKDQKKTKKKSD